MATDDEIRPLWHDIIRIDAVLLDDPFTSIIHAPETEARRGNEAAVA